MIRTSYLAGGCFWGMQKYLDQFDGILRTEAGYANGALENPSYEQVCNDSGHMETVRVEYDDGIISTQELVGYYFTAIDPLSVNKQGGDTGIQYRTGIYYTDDGLLCDIREVYDEKERELGQELAVELLPLQNFYRAEEYHQKYLDKNPGGYCHIPKELFRMERNSFRKSAGQ